MGNCHTIVPGVAIHGIVLTEPELTAVHLSWDLVCSPENDRSIEIGKIAFLRLFERSPESLDMFFFRVEPNWKDGSHFEHHCKVVVKILGHVVHVVRDPEKVDRNVTALGFKHSLFPITAEQFDMLRDDLIFAFDFVLGGNFTPEARSGWTKLYNIMSVMLQESMERYHKFDS